MKPVPQRTYTRKGTIFKTVDGVRRKFGKTMIVLMKVSTELESEILHTEIEIECKKQADYLNAVPEIQYTLKEGIEVSIFGDDFIRQLATVRMIFERVKP